MYLEVSRCFLLPTYCRIGPIKNLSPVAAGRSTAHIILFEPIETLTKTMPSDEEEASMKSIQEGAEQPKTTASANGCVRNPRFSRALIVVGLLAAGAIAGSLTYVFVHDEEEDEFDRQVSSRFSRDIGITGRRQLQTKLTGLALAPFRHLSMPSTSTRSSRSPRPTSIVSTRGLNRSPFFTPPLPKRPILNCLS